MNSTFQIFTYFNDNNDIDLGSATSPASITKKGLLIPFIDTKNKKLRLVSIDCRHNDVLEVPTPILCSFDSPQIYNSNGAQHKIFFTSNGATTFNENFYLNQNIMNNQNIEFSISNVDLANFTIMTFNFKYFLMNIEIC